MKLGIEGKPPGFITPYFSIKCRYSLILRVFSHNQPNYKSTYLYANPCENGVKMA